MATAIDMDLTPVQAMSLAGMVRISNGTRQRCIWPVHLPGWLALGWQVAGSTSTQVPGGVSSIAPLTQVALPASEPAQSRRRGRKAKTVEPADTPDSTDSSRLVERGAASTDANAAEPEQFDTTTSDAAPGDSGSDAAAEVSSESAAVSLGFPLPEDLLNAEF